VSFRPSTTSLGRYAIGLAAALALGACSSAGPAVTPGATTAITVTPGATAPAATAGATLAAATSGAGSGTAVVNLTFTGTSVFDAKGTKGTCKVLLVNGSPRFGFEATDADYPGLGLSYSMAELNANTVDVKWAVNATTAYGNNPQSHIDLGADHRTVTIDQDLLPFAMGGVTAGPEHVRGVINCPA
jgi:hypothetical protein